jgi:hypothetical protein
MRTICSGPAPPPPDRERVDQDLAELAGKIGGGEALILVPADHACREDHRPRAEMPFE